LRASLGTREKEREKKGKGKAPRAICSRRDGIPATFDPIFSEKPNTARGRKGIREEERERGRENARGEGELLNIDVALNNSSRVSHSPDISLRATSRITG